jgi:hypothetical protein
MQDRSTFYGDLVSELPVTRISVVSVRADLHTILITGTNFRLKQPIFI